MCRALGVVLAIGIATPAIAATSDAMARQAPRDAPQLVSLRDGAAVHAALDEVIRLDLDGVPLARALDEAAAQARVRIAYASDVIPSDRRVSLRDDRITLRDAIVRILAGTRLDVLVSRNGNLVVVRRSDATEGQPNGNGADRVQAGTITGTVTEAGTQRPLPAVQVVVEGTGLGTFTDRDGRFRIEDVPAGNHQVAASSIGYQESTQDVAIAGGATATVDFTLEIAPTALTELVVTVTGQQRRVELGHVVGRIDADSVVRDAPVNSLTDLISGRVAGVQVLHQSGLAGTTPRIRIRGLSSTAMSNDAIVVVDGVRVDNSTGPSSSTTGQATVTGMALRGGRLNDLNPEEIESIEIAKGPSAATLYGTDAANGVIVITTKRGRAGPARWRAWIDQGWATSAIDEFPDNYIAWGQTETDATPRRCTLQDVAAGACTGIDSISRFNPLNDPETTPFTTGRMQSYGLQVSGGSEQLTYLFSGELSDQDGYVQMPPAEAERFESIHGPGTLDDDFLRPNTERRVSLRANMTAAIDENAELSGRVSYVGNRALLVADGAGSVISSAVRGPGYRDALNGYGTARVAPATAFATTREENVDHFVSSLSAQWRPASWLTTRFTAGLDHVSSDRSGLSRTGEGEQDGGAFDQVLLRTTNYSVDLGSTATAPITPRWTSATSVGGQYNRRDEMALFTTARNLPPGGTGPAGATSTTVRNRRDDSYVLGVYVQEQLSLNGRLFLTGAVRGDGGSAFGDDVTLAAYPKASVSWLLSEESFMPRPGWLTSLRLRAAWGASGVQPRRADVVPSYAFTNAIVDGVVVPAAQLNEIGNPDLEPERQRELELGFDTELFGDRIRLEATYYNRASENALVRVPVLPSHGSFFRWENLGSVRNRGVEAALRVALIDSRPLRWDVNIAGSYNRNRLLELAPGIPELRPASRHRHTPGFPIWGLWESEFTFDDADANGVITADEIAVGDTAVFVGSSMPTREITVASTVSLFDDRIRIGTQFDHRGGHFRTDNNEVSRCSSLASSCRGLNDPTASLEEQARSLATTPAGGLIMPIHDASFVRLRELSITYNADARISQLLGGRRVSLTLGARNLALWTDFPGADPEASTTLFSSSGSDAFANNGAFPQARTWTLRLQIGN